VDVTENVEIGGRRLAVVHPPDAVELIDEEAFEHEEFLPYWAELWPSSVALAETVAALPLQGRRVVELGCGLALPAIVAALGGAQALATDWSPDALAYAERNALGNGADLETLRVAWREPEALVQRGPFELVLAADVLYERRNGPLLLAALDAVVAEGGEAWIADPGRPGSDEFLAAAAASFSVEALRPRIWRLSR
jgi:predicted nicotinamide N-methyase